MTILYLYQEYGATILALGLSGLVQERILIGPGGSETFPDSALAIFACIRGFGKAKVCATARWKPRGRCCLRTYAGIEFSC